MALLLPAHPFLGSHELSGSAMPDWTLKHWKLPAVVTGLGAELSWQCSELPWKAVTHRHRTIRMAHAWHPSSWKMEAEGSGVEDLCSVSAVLSKC